MKKQAAAAKAAALAKQHAAIIKAKVAAKMAALKRAQELQEKKDALAKQLTDQRAKAQKALEKVKAAVNHLEIKKKEKDFSKSHIKMEV